MRRLGWILVLASGCASAPSAPRPDDGCARSLPIRDGDRYRDLAQRAPPAGPLCLRYHRARAEVAWAVTPSEAAPIFRVTRAAIEIVEGGRLVGAWYGPCAGEPALRGEVAPEATHYMVRFLALRRPPAVQIQVGAGVSAVDLMFALETMTEFGHALYLDPRPVTEVPACQASDVAEVRAEGPDEPEVARIDGGLLAAVVSPRLPLIQSCFRRTIRPLPCSSLVRRVDLGIDPRGMVVDAVVADHTLGAPAVDACVGAAIWDLVFPAPAAESGVRGSLKFQNCEQAPNASPSLDFGDP